MVWQKKSNKKDSNGEIEEQKKVIVISNNFKSKLIELSSEKAEISRMDTK